MKKEIDFNSGNSYYTKEAVSPELRKAVYAIIDKGESDEPVGDYPLVWNGDGGPSKEHIYVSVGEFVDGAIDYAKSK